MSFDYTFPRLSRLLYRFVNLLGVEPLDLRHYPKFLILLRIADGNIESLKEMDFTVNMVEQMWETLRQMRDENVGSFSPTLISEIDTLLGLLGEFEKKVMEDPISY